MRQALLVAVILPAHLGFTGPARYFRDSRQPGPERMVITYLEDRHRLTGDRPVVTLCGVAPPDSTDVARLIASEVVVSATMSCEEDPTVLGTDAPRRLMIVGIRSTERGYAVSANLWLGPCNSFAERSVLGPSGRHIVSFSLVQRPATECILVSPDTG